MVTYQDLIAVGDNETDRIEFIRSAINQWQASDLYKTAEIADKYDRKLSPDISQYTKMLYTVTGRQIPDTWSSNYKVGRHFFPFFITQENQYLLSNGVTWENSATKDKLGTKKAEFDTMLQDAGHAALSGAVSFGFWNFDHLEVFNALEFVPMFDEENGALMSGIRYWQIDSSKPLRATLYEIDGCTDYIWNRRHEGNESHEYGEILHAKRPYKIKATGTDVDAEKIYQGENYPTFPIVPLWGNKKHQSEIVGLREQIFVYDMIKSGFCNSVEDASYIFWAIHNAPGMDDVSLAEFMGRVRKLHVAVTEETGSDAVPQQLEAPYASREALLDRLEHDLFDDAMAFNPKDVKSGAVVTAQIRAAYTNLDMKVNDFEYCVRSFINAILELAGIDDNPTFTRSVIINQAEEIQTVLQAASSLDDEYVTKKVLTILGDGDQAEEIIKRKIEDEVTRQRDEEEQMRQEEQRQLEQRQFEQSENPGGDNE